MANFIGAIKKGIAGVQSAYEKQKKEAEARAKRRMDSAKTKWEKERIKAELERKHLQLKRDMYRAKAAVKQEKLAVARAKREAGIVSFGERATKFLAKTYKGLQAPPKKRRTTRRK